MTITRFEPWNYLDLLHRAVGLHAFDVFSPATQQDGLCGDEQHVRHNATFIRAGRQTAGGGRAGGARQRGGGARRGAGAGEGVAPGSVAGGAGAGQPALAVGVAASVVIAGLVSPCIQIAYEWEKAVVLRFGKFRGLKGSGLFTIFPIIDKVANYVDQRIRVTDFKAETTLTQDTVPVNVDAIAFWMVWDAEKSVLEVADYEAAVTVSAQMLMWPPCCHRTRTYTTYSAGKPDDGPARAGPRCLCSSRSSRLIIRSRIRSSPLTSASGRRQFSVEKAQMVRISMPNSTLASRTGRMFSVPARCPASRGRPRALAQRPFPSMIMAICLGLWPACRHGSRKRSSTKLFDLSLSRPTRICRS